MIIPAPSVRYSSERVQERRPAVGMASQYAPKKRYSNLENMRSFGQNGNREKEY